VELEETRELRVIVPREELQQLGEKLAREVQDLDDAMTRHGAARKSMKEDEETRNGSIKRISRIVATGIDHRPVRCARFYDFGAGKVTISRIDTGEIVQTREITDRERQDNLPAMGGGEGHDFAGVDPRRPPRLGDPATSTRSKRPPRPTAPEPPDPGTAAPDPAATAQDGAAPAQDPALTDTAAPTVAEHDKPGKARKRNRKR